MNKVTTNQAIPENKNHQNVASNEEVNVHRTCDGCDESIFCELATFNDRRCKDAVSEK